MQRGFLQEDCKTHLGALLIIFTTILRSFFSSTMNPNHEIGEFGDE